MTDIIPVTVSPVDLLRFHEPTPPEERQTRPDRATWQHKPSCPGKGCPQQRDPNAHVQLTYVDARYVQRRLDEVVGPANWQDKYTMEGSKVSCLIGIRVSFGDTTEWVFKGDGAGATDIEGDKGSFSDAFKRAAVAWGIARDLYGEDAPTTQGQGVVAGSVTAPDNGASQPAPAAPAVSPQPVAAPTDGVCPTHGTPWRTTKGNGQPAKRAYCSGKMADGSYCDQYGPWLQPKA